MISRIDAIKIITEHIGEKDLIISSTGMISRELFYTCDRPANFYMIGSMGLASAMGLGLAIQNPNRQIWVLDGDGSALMSLGTIPLISYEGPSNFNHIVLDNEAYESTGSQPSISSTISIKEIAISSGYKDVLEAKENSGLKSVLSKRLLIGPSMIVIKVGISDSKDIPRVKYSPETIRDRFRTSILSN